MHIPTPKLATRSHYSYELDQPVRVPAETGAPVLPNYLGDVCRVGVMFNTWQGEARPTTVTATTITGRSAFASTPLDGFTPGINEDARLLDVFADIIADAQLRHTGGPQPAAYLRNGLTPREQLAARAGIGADSIADTKRAHPAYQTDGARSATFPRDFTLVDGGRLAYRSDLHACQHGNDVHGCTCTFGGDHSARSCTGYDRG